MKPLLFYHQHLHPSDDLIEGRLVLLDAENLKVLNTYIATSGLAGSQTFAALSLRGRGSIPPINLVGIDHYQVTTTPIYMPGVKGVEGDFFKIDPHQVSISGAERGDFGVHFDANVPGSSGCVVLRTAVGWEALKQDFKKFADKNIKQVALVVSYSR